MTDALSGSTVLITGGTGSFGNRVASYVRRFGPAEIRILSRDEKKQWEMRQRYPDFRYLIGDVRDENSIADAVRGADFVFHAAALKQVPSCEMYPAEAVKTNVLGTLNLCNAARAAGVRTVVALSTDKAVKPINAMGISKAMMEKIISAQNQFEQVTTFCAVRYGNVMGSRGSVIPLFMKLIGEERALPLTHPGMTRFMMTLDESVDLVIHALTSARGGEIFVRKAPACTVSVLAQALARKYSRRGGDHPIEEVGIRPGEKMHEVLVNEYEMLRVTEEQNYFVIHPEYGRAPVKSSATFGAEYTSENTRRLTEYSEIESLLDAMGPTESYI
jgi:UDP-N-acetylglucosamine 4,6-dehydratase